MINGLLNIYKEKGFTSFDVCAVLRGILETGKVGHTGTLDPDAEGVLIACTGNATKIAGFLLDETKTYEAVLLLGKTSDTQDYSGNILAEKDVQCTEEEVRECVRKYIGEIEQIPPMYSAIKVNGKKLYELARKGKVVDRKPRRIMIEDIEILDVSLPEVTMKVNCSKGTYIRTLCNDIGETLGCGGLMKSLKRTRVGSFDVEDSIKLSTLREMTESLSKAEKEEVLKQVVLAPDKYYISFPKVVCNEADSRLLLNGNRIENSYIEDAEKLQYVRMYCSDDTFKGIYAVIDNGKVFKAFKMFI